MGLGGTVCGLVRVDSRCGWAGPTDSPSLACTWRCWSAVASRHDSLHSAALVTRALQVECARGGCICRQRPGKVVRPTAANPSVQHILALQMNEAFDEPDTCHTAAILSWLNAAAHAAACLIQRRGWPRPLRCEQPKSGCKSRCSGHHCLLLISVSRIHGSWAWWGEAAQTRVTSAAGRASGAGAPQCCSGRPTGERGLATRLPDCV